MSKRPGRSYDGAARRRRAGETRARIMAAARALFEARGLDRVTIDALAAEARVSPATVYGLFRSKAGLVRAMMEASLFNDRYRALAARTARVRDPAALLRMTAAIARAIYDGERAQLGLVRGASAFSSDLREVEQQFEQARFELQAPRARRIVRMGAARPGLTLARVRDVTWLLTGRDPYRMLVVERGWTSDAYEAWLGDALERTLLRAAGDPPGRARAAATGARRRSRSG